MEIQYQFHDVFGLDPDLLAMIPQPCIALLLLFPINEKVHCTCICVGLHVHGAASVAQLVERSV